MNEIKIQKRYKFAGDVFTALIEKCGFPVEIATDFLNSIPDAPTVDDVPVVRGEWNDVKGNISWFYQCSECGVFHEYKTNFCKHCGADMRGEKDE